MQPAFFKSLNASVGRSCWKCLKCTWDKIALLPKDHPWWSWIAHPPSIGPLCREAAPLVSPLLPLCFVSSLKAGPRSGSSLGHQSLESRCPVCVCWLWSSENFCSVKDPFKPVVLFLCLLVPSANIRVHPQTRSSVLTLGTSCAERGIRVPFQSRTESRWTPVPREEGFCRGMYLIGGWGSHFHGLGCKDWLQGGDINPCSGNWYGCRVWHARS